VPARIAQSWESPTAIADAVPVTPFTAFGGANSPPGAWVLKPQQTTAPVSRIAQL